MPNRITSANVPTWRTAPRGFDTLVAEHTPFEQIMGRGHAFEEAIVTCPVCQERKQSLWGSCHNEFCLSERANVTVYDQSVFEPSAISNGTISINQDLLTVRDSAGSRRVAIGNLDRDLTQISGRSVQWVSSDEVASEEDFDEGIEEDFDEDAAISDQPVSLRVDSLEESVSEIRRTLEGWIMADGGTISTSDRYSNLRSYMNNFHTRTLYTR